MNDLYCSKLTAKSQTVIPAFIRRKLGLKPGDMIRYKITGDHIELEKLRLETEAEDPFAAFSEWASPEDEDAYKVL